MSYDCSRNIGRLVLLKYECPVPNFGVSLLLCGPLAAPSLYDAQSAPLTHLLLLGRHPGSIARYHIRTKALFTTMTVVTINVFHSAAPPPSAFLPSILIEMSVRAPELAHIVASRKGMSC